MAFIGYDGNCQVAGNTVARNFPADKPSPATSFHSPQRCASVSAAPPTVAPTSAPARFAPPATWTPGRGGRSSRMHPHATRAGEIRNKRSLHQQAGALPTTSASLSALTRSHTSDTPLQPAPAPRAASTATACYPAQRSRPHALLRASYSGTPTTRCLPALATAYTVVGCAMAAELAARLTYRRHIANSTLASTPTATPRKPATSRTTAASPATSCIRTVCGDITADPAPRYRCWSHI